MYTHKHAVRLDEEHHHTHADITATVQVAVAGQELLNAGSILTHCVGYTAWLDRASPNKIPRPFTWDGLAS